MVITEDKGLSVAEAGKRVIVPLSATNDYLAGNTSSSR